MVQAESKCQGSQAGAADGIVDEEPDADKDLLQWSHALDFDNYTRYVRCSSTLCLGTAQTLPSIDTLLEMLLGAQVMCSNLWMHSQSPLQSLHLM